jgi:type I restriction enzyme S subunit
MPESGRKTALNNGETWPLRYVADPDVAALNPNYAAETGKTYPFVPMENIREQCEGLSGFESRMLDAGGYTFFKNGDIIFAKITPCTENGKIARVEELPAEVGFGSTEFIIVSPRPSVDERFLYYQLARGDVRALCTSLMEGTTGRQRVPVSIFRKRIQIPVPPDRDEQAAIADALELIDNAVRAARESIAKLERLQKSLMQQLLTGRLKPDGTPRTESEFKPDDYFGRLPHAWQSARLKKLISSCEYGLSRAMSDHGRYPIFRMNNIERGRMVGTPLAHIDLSQEDFARYRVRKGDILFNRTNTVELVGKVGIFALEGEFAFASYLVRLVANDENDPRFLNYYLNSFEGQKRIAAKVTPSIGQANINTRSLKSVWVVKPPHDEQSAIADRLDSIFELIRAKEEKIAALQHLKKSLMQNLLTGHIRLPLKDDAKEAIA